MRISLSSDHNILINNLNMSAFWQIHALPTEWAACLHESGPSRKAWMTTGIHFKIHKVMNCGFTGTETRQQPLQWTSKLSSHHKRQDMFKNVPTVFFFKSWSCALWISSTRSDRKSASYLKSVYSKCKIKTTTKGEFWDLISPPSLCTCLFCLDCTWISG
jgi:hypothetical protein